MALGELQLIPTGVVTVQSAVQVVERGTLLALSVLWSETPPVWPQCFVRAGLANPDTPSGNLTLLLASGYLDFRNGPHWSGEIKLFPGMQLVLFVNTPATTIIKLAWLTRD